MTASSAQSDAGTPGRWWWLALLGLALTELVGHYVIRSRVPNLEDWESAAERVRAEHRATDLVVVAPSWADPVLRWVAGDILSIADAAPSDVASHERLWELSIRGHDHLAAPDAEAGFEEQHGRVRLRRWDLGPSRVVYDFVDNVRSADVSLTRNGRSTPCRWRDTGPPRGGGLGAGAMWPSERFVCPGQPWLWVGETVTEDLELQPRRCIWQHPPGREPMVATFSDVPLGERMVFYGGLYYEHERKREGGPIHVAIKVDGRVVGRMIHRDGDGWKRMEAETRLPDVAEATPDARGDVSVEVTAENPHLRTFCWSATTRAGDPRDVDQHVVGRAEL